MNFFSLRAFMNYLRGKRKSQEEIIELAEKTLGFTGAMISWSKSAYRHDNPENFVIFNANICTKNGKVWYGDIDLTSSKEKLLNFAKESGETIYVLYEMDGRFENESKPTISKAAAIVHSSGKISLRSDLEKKYENFSNI
jgi:hypothetical protein